MHSSVKRPVSGVSHDDVYDGELSPLAERLLILKLLQQQRLALLSSVSDADARLTRQRSGIDPVWKRFQTGYSFVRRKSHGTRSQMSGEPVTKKLTFYTV
jgi:hypothetical protein